MTAKGPSAIADLSKYNISDNEVRLLTVRISGVVWSIILIVVTEMKNCSMKNCEMKTCTISEILVISRKWCKSEIFGWLQYADQ